MEWRSPSCNSWKFVHLAGGNHTGATTVSKDGHVLLVVRWGSKYTTMQTLIVSTVRGCESGNDSGIEFGVGKHIQGNVYTKDGQEASANHSIFDTITGKIKLCNTGVDLHNK